MKRFKITTSETEIWMREYIIEARSDLEAEKKFNNGDYDCLDGECIDAEVNNIEVEEVN